MGRKFEPLLSAKIFSTKQGETEKNYSLIRFPVMGSIKYDGIRLIEYNRLMHTRSLKPLRNRTASRELEKLIVMADKFGLRGLDGEIGVGELNHPNLMQNTTSGVMSYEGDPDFRFMMFDSYQHADVPFEKRYVELQKLYHLIREEFPWLVFVEQVWLENMDELLAYEAEVVAMGYEGIMVRSPTAHYKMGRSTMRENILMALKRFVDDEALVLEYREELENANTATKNALGRTQRSGHAANMIPKGRMGTMICKSLRFDETFRLGGGRGITHAVRQEIWDNPHLFQWRVAKYVYQEVGVKERPRLPRWKGWRSWDDMDAPYARQLLAQAEGYPCSAEGISALEPQHMPGL